MDLTNGNGSGSAGEYTSQEMNTSGMQQERLVSTPNGTADIIDHDDASQVDIANANFITLDGIHFTSET